MSDELRRDLHVIERDIALGLQAIRQLIRVVADLDRHGQDAAAARAELVRLREKQALLGLKRDAIMGDLSWLKGKAHLD